MCDMTHPAVPCVTWLILRCRVWRDSSCGAMCDVTHPAVPCVTWLILRCRVWRDSSCGAVCDVTHPAVRWIAFSDGVNVWRDSLRGATSHSYVWHDSFIWVTWLVHMCGVTRSHVWHDSFTCVIWRICGYQWVSREGDAGSVTYLRL